MPDDAIVAYCVKCRAKREMQDPEAVYTESSRAGMKGTCPVCHGTMFRMGKTEAHENLPKPTPKIPTGRLVIVESPAKARTVGRFLGKGYRVKASIGHVRDLLRSQLSVDVENDFEPRYRIPNEKRKVVKELKDEVKDAAEVYLATDPDREGEAIAWHLMAAADIDQARTRRVVFHEITQGAISEAFAHARDINMDLVNAQQARRILDRLVGYKISPLLWERVRSRLSAGRVQSVAVRLIVEREREIQAFIPVEYWSIDALLAKQEERGKKHPQTFLAHLHRIRGKEVDLKNEKDTQAIVADLQNTVYTVTRVKKDERRRNPSPPFTTSTLQQEASRRLGFTAKQTMANAQALYEGVPLEKGENVGLITYMRTDSTNVAEVAQKETRDFVTATYGQEFLPARPPIYKTRSKSAQEAHEAIRPTSVFRTPDSVQPYLNRAQLRLYTLIWQRFVASQMAPAILDTISVDIEAGEKENGRFPYLFRAAGSSVKFKGFLSVYEERADEDAVPDEEEGKMLPPLTEGEVLDLIKLLSEQHFTQPPPRYTEATLVRTLEEYGIGRPSTYAPIISTIQARGYVERIDRRLVPTEIAFTINDLLVKYFPDILDVGFTAQMEEKLDLIANGDQEWVRVLRDFYGPFEQEFRQAEATMTKLNLGDQPTGENCELCGHPLIVKFGRYGKFVACSNYPACRNTKPFLVKMGIACPECGGDLVKRRARRGRIFYGCANYPACQFTSWNQPLPQPCPVCGGLLVMDKKDRAKCLKCEERVPLEQLERAEDTKEAEIQTARDVLRSSDSSGRTRGREHKERG
jgi:DNA topoisomerase-1